MAVFDKAFTKVLKLEGGYSNHPDDKGGETFAGIARKYNPKLKFWNTIDAIKKVTDKKELKKEINNLLKNDKVLDEIKHCYKTNYWDKLYLDNCKSQRIANTIFCDGVNRGVKPTIKSVRIILGLKSSTIADEEYINKLSKL